MNLLQRYDRSSRWLLALTTLLAISLLSVPQIILHTHRPDAVVWATKDLVQGESKMVILPGNTTFRFFDGANCVTFDLATGKRISNWAPPLSNREEQLSYDGHFVMAPSSGNNIRIWDASTGKALPSRHLQIPSRGSSSEFNIRQVTSHQIGIDCGRVPTHIPAAFVSPIDGTYELNTGSRLNKISSKDRHRHIYGISFATRPNGNLLVGGIDGKDGSSNLVLRLFEGSIIKYQLKLPEQTSQHITNSYSWFYKPLLINSKETRVFGALHQQVGTGLGRLAQITCWNTTSSQPVWTWQEKDTEALSMALSPDEDYLLVAADISAPHTYAKTTRLIVLDAHTGSVVRSYERYKGGSSRWEKLTAFVKKTPDTFFSGNYNVGTVAGLTWIPDGNSFLAAYSDGEIRRWRFQRK